MSFAFRRLQILTTRHASNVLHWVGRQTCLHPQGMKTSTRERESCISSQTNSTPFQKIVNGTITKSAHPARFSPDDKYSRHRVTLKKRFNLLLTQLPAKEFWGVEESRGKRFRISRDFILAQSLYITISIIVVKVRQSHKMILLLCLFETVCSLSCNTCAYCNWDIFEPGCLSNDSDAHFLALIVTNIVLTFTYVHIGTHTHSVRCYAYVKLPVLGW